jgi:hypothetical protein
VSPARATDELRAKYAPGGGWKLLQPGPLWEACEIWLDEMRQFGSTILDHALKHAELRGALRHTAELEKLRRFIHEWANWEQDDYIMPGFEAFMADRGIKVNQEVGNIPDQVQWCIAQATKELLARIPEVSGAD